MKQWIKGIVLAVGFAASTVAANDIDETWLKELVQGQDLSVRSLGYAESISASNSTAKKRAIGLKSPLVDFEQARKSLAAQMRRCLLNETGCKNNTALFELSMKRLASAEQTAQDWLDQMGQIKGAKAVRNSIQNQAAALKGVAKQSFAELFSVNKEALAWFLDSNDDVQVAEQPILRNDFLPFDNNQGQAPQLDLTTAITPSYHDPAATPPSAEDGHMESDPALFELAASLDHDYIRIYNFVRQEVKHQFYAGSMKGAAGTLASLAGNDVDQASLLIALLRASGVAARYVHGVVEQPVEDLMTAMGVDSANEVMQGLSRAGIAHEAVIGGGAIQAIRHQATWVSAYIPYAHYRGSANDLNDPVWLPLAPAHKHFEVSDTGDDFVLLNLDGQAITEAYLSGQGGGLSPMAYWQEQKEAAEIEHSTNPLPLTVTENSDYVSLIPASLPFQVVTTHAETAVLDSSHEHLLALEVVGPNDVLLTHQLAVSKVAGKRLTLSYLPATVDDLNTINQAGGMALVPPSWVKLRPVIKLDGKVIATGTTPIGMGQMHDLHITLSSQGVSKTVNRRLPSGSYVAMALTTQDDDYPLDDEAIDGALDEVISARLMHNLGLNYQKQWQRAEKQLASQMQLPLIRPLPGLVLVTPEYQMQYAQGIPVGMQVAGISLDAVSRTVDVIGSNASLNRDWMRLAALHGSWLESNIFISQWQVEATSADKILKAQNNLIHLMPDNLNAALPGLAISDQAKSHLATWVSQGFHALVGEQGHAENAWHGDGWHIWHPETGASGYFISGGYAGGQSTENFSDWISDALRSQLSDPYGDGANPDTLSATSIRIVEESNHQFGTVDQMLDQPSRVRVSDAGGRPVEGALAQFTVINGGGQIDTDAGLVSTTQVLTNHLGVAEVDIKLPQNIFFGPLVTLDPSDTNKTQLGLVEMSVSVLTHQGFLSADRHFNHYAKPGEPANLYVNDCNWIGGVCERFSGQQNRYAGRSHVIVMDAFGNPVSNVAVTISGMSPIEPTNNKSKASIIEPTQHLHDAAVTFRAPTASGEAGSIFQATEQDKQNLDLKSGTSERCEAPSPSRMAVGSCMTDAPWSVPACASESVQLVSDHTWTSFVSYNGVGRPATRFPISLTASGLDAVEINRYNGFEFAPGNFAPTGYMLIGDDHNGPNGEFFGNEPGGDLSGALTPVYFGYQSDGTTNGCVFTEHEIDGYDERTTALLEGEGQITVEPSETPWLYDVQLGTTPGKNRHEIKATNLRFEGVGIYPGSSYNELGAIVPSYTVSAQLVERYPAQFRLNDGGYLMESNRFTFAMGHPDFQPMSVRALFYQDDDVIDWFDVSYPTGPIVSFFLSPGHLIDAASEYHIQLVFNQGTAHEFSLEKEPIDGLNRRLIRAVGCTGDDGLTTASACGGPVINNQFNSPVVLSTSVDLANAGVCRINGFVLELNADANVNIDAIRHDIEGNPTGPTINILSNESLVAGSNQIDVQAETMGNHRYTLVITATALDNGDEDQAVGALVSRYDLSNALPIGHAVVKGVDLADGSMVYSKKDIALVSPGADLEFLRTYSSQGRHQLSTLGYGWTHNYLSRITVNNCGVVTVTGSDAGSARFQIQGDAFVPLKGYHSSLVLNEDGSFDFYPKGGMRYHYIKLQEDAWWMHYAEDPNGNRLTVNWSPRAGAPVITSVVDSVGRSLVFSYELFDFGIYRSEMLRSVKGPDGIELTFDYDGLGNLVSAKREGDSTDETLNYTGDQTGPSRSLLLSVADNPRSSTRTWTYRENSIDGSTLGIPTIASIETASITETDSGTTTFNYTDGLGYNSAASVDQNDLVSQYTLNAYGAATEITTPAGTKSFDWETGTDVLLMSETDENDRLRSFEYDQFGNVTEERLGSMVSSYSYETPDQFNPPYIKDRIKSMTNWRGHETTYSYDAQGNRTSETLGGIEVSYDYNDLGLRVSMTDGRDLVTRYTYDAYGYPKTVRNPENEVAQTEYSVRGLKLTETDGRGIVTEYQYDASDRITSKKIGPSEWLTDYEQGGRVRIETDPNGHSTRQEYDAAGRLLKVINAKTDEMTYVYDLNGNKTSETDFGGHTTTFDYDEADRLEVKTEPVGSDGNPKITTYTYDGVGNVKSETTGNRITEYDYDPNRYFQTNITRKSDEGDQLIIRTVDGNGNIETETNPNGHTTTYTYDAHDRLLTASGPLGSGRVLTYDGNGNLETETTLNSTANQTTIHTYDLANRKSQTTLPEGGRITYEYDKAGNLIAESRPNGYRASYGYNHLSLPDMKHVDGEQWQLTYDLAGNLETETGPIANPQVTAVQTITTEYDQLNRPIKQSDVIGLISETTYDADSNILTTTDGNGHVTVHSYNDLHQKVTTTEPLSDGQTRTLSFTYTHLGELLTETGPNGTITHTVDQLGRRRTSTGPDEYNMVYTYDMNGNLTDQTDSRGITTSHIINELDQITSTTRGGYTQSFTHDTVGNLLTETDRRGILTEHTYDKENRRTETTRAGVRQVTTTYNKAGLPVIVKDANGHNTVHEYNDRYHKTRTIRPENLITSYTPNAYGDVTHQNNPGPNDITRTFDERRRLISETNGANETTQYEYDLNNNRTAVIKPEGQRWEYDFDHANRLITVRNVPEAIETHYSYDAANNLKTITDAEQKVTTLGYDDRNRKTSKTYHDTQVVGYGYDKNGNLASTTLPNGVNITYGHDDLDRQTSQTYSGSHGDATVTFTLDGNGNIEQVDETIDGQTHTTTMAYDDWDRRTQKVDRYGHTFEYTYDDNGNRKVFKDHNDQLTTYQYDKVNRLKTLGNPNTGTFSWTYNTAGIPEQLAYPNGSEANYAYDAANRIKLIDNKQSGVTVTSHAYEYDKNGNREQLTESNINASQITSYTYDDADRLTQVNYPNKIHTYTLDKVGNRDQEIIDDPINGINTITYNYNQRDQLTTVTDTEGLNVTYDYDEAGNQTLKTENGVTTDFSYTPRNRIKSITIGGASPIEYQYDYSGQRVNIQANGTEKRHLYDGLTLIAETNTIGNTLARYHYGLNHQVAETRNNQSAYYLSDSLGTTVAITNHDGSIQNRMDYDVWGNLNQESASSDSPFGFTGYQKDDDTGLYYANARYYDSFTGRFLREDPLEGDILQPMSIHRYLYAFANSTVWVDPTGEGNDKAHFYLEFFAAKANGYSNFDALEHAIVAISPDMLKKYDAIKNSLYVLLGQYERPKNNNRGIHALTGQDVEDSIDAVNAFVKTGAINKTDISFVRHFEGDIRFHIPKDLVGNDVSNQKQHGSIIGHFFEWTFADKNYLYPDKMEAFFDDAVSRLASTNANTNQKAFYSEKIREVYSRVRERFYDEKRTITRRGQTYRIPTKSMDQLEAEEMHKLFVEVTGGEYAGFSTHNVEAGDDLYELLKPLSMEDLRKLAGVSAKEQEVIKFSRKSLISLFEQKIDISAIRSRDFINGFLDMRREQRFEKMKIILENAEELTTDYGHID